MVPTAPPTVTTTGSETVATHHTDVDEDHEVVEHSAVPTRPEGVVFSTEKLRPMTERLP